MDERYLPPIPGGRWAISRYVEGQWIHLIESGPLEDEADAQAILHALGVKATSTNIEHYFPHRGSYGRCPTLELLELCNTLDPTNPTLKQKRLREAGV